MKLIAHRGNLFGPDASQENNPKYIDNAIQMGYDAEIDLWITNGDFMLGHDYGQYPITTLWLANRSKSLWVHCKNIAAFHAMVQMKMNSFWHNTDDYTFTRDGYVWAYPGKPPIGNITVMVMPEYKWKEVWRIKENTEGAFGICSDLVGLIK
jgi:hypothetical protein